MFGSNGVRLLIRLENIADKECIKYSKKND